MPVESGRFKAFVDFISYPQKVSITYKDEYKIEVLTSDLIFLRALVKKAIIKAAALAPTEEEKKRVREDREHLAKLRALKRPTALLKLGQLQQAQEQKHASHQGSGPEISSEGVGRWRAARTRSA